MWRRLLRLLIVAFLGLPAIAQASGRTMALGSDGALYQVLTGRHGDLFPAAAPSTADNSVLAIEVSRAGSPTSRFLVPGTDDAAVESAPFLVYQNGLDTAFVVWESRVNGFHSRINLASLRAGVFSETINLLADFWSLKSSPRIIVTTERYKVENAAGAATTHQRTIIQTLWWEQAGAGERTVYSPVILEDGAYIGWNPVLVLDDLDTSGATAAFALPESFVRSPGVSSGDAQNSLMLSFVNPKTGRLLHLDVEVLPWRLTALASKLRDYLAGLGPNSAGTMQSIADLARAHILISGARDFNSTYLVSIANDVRARILAMPKSNGLPRIAADARAHILISGIEISDVGPRPEAAGIWTMEVAKESPDSVANPSGELAAVIQLRVAASILAPRIGGGPTTILSSPTGNATLVAWEEANAFRYREHDGLRWSDTKVLALSPTLTRESAIQILEDRVRGN